MLLRSCRGAIGEVCARCNSRGDTEGHYHRRGPMRTDRQQRMVARCHALGRELERAARSVFSQDAGPRLGLLRDAATCFVAAAAADADPEAEVTSFDASAAWLKLDSLVAQGVVAPLPEGVTAARRWLAAARPVEAPAGEEGRLAVASAFAAVRWLAKRVEPRTPGGVRRARVVQATALGAVLFAVVVGMAARALAPRDLALGKPVTASSKDESHGRRPAGLTNGIVEDTCGAETANDDEAPWFLVDLGEARPLRRVVVVTRGDGEPNDNLPLEVAVGETPSSLTTLGARTSPFDPTRRWTLDVGGRKVRYVRVRKTTRGLLALAEVEAYG